MEAYAVSMHPKKNTKPGCLIPIEKSTIGFDIKRVFYIYGLTDHDENIRGHHGHTNTWQYIICLHGKVNIETTFKETGTKKVFVLDDPANGLMLPPNNYIVMNLQRNSILMVSCDTEFKDEISYT
jgi:hypothetical protein